MGSVQSSVVENPKIVFFDLEATGSQDSEIVQIGAVDLAGKKTFNEYVFPVSGAMSRHASRITGITIEDQTMYRRHKVVEPGTLPRKHMWLSQKVYAKSPETALQEFISWLRHTVGGPVILVAYGGLNFDARVLATQLDEYNLDCRDVVKVSCCSNHARGHD